MNQLDEFQQRLNRIKMREQKGLALGAMTTETKRRSVVARLGRLLSPPLLLILSAALGIIAVLALRLAFYHIAGANPAQQITAQDIALTAGLGFAAAFITAQLLGLSTPLQSLSLIAGVALAVSGFHNLFHWAPAQMSAAFSPEYVNGAAALAGPNTLLLAGQAYEIIPADSVVIATLSAWAAGPTALAEAEPAATEQPKLLQLDSTK